MELRCQNNLSFEGRVIRAFLAGGLLLGLLILFIMPPADLPFAGCTFHSITGYSCLTCGMTRSLHAISHGELAASLRYHLFGPAVFLLMLLASMIFTAEAISGREPAVHAGKKVKLQVLLFFVVVWFVYWGVRLAEEFAA